MAASTAGKVPAARKTNSLWSRDCDAGDIFFFLIMLPIQFSGSDSDPDRAGINLQTFLPCFPLHFTFSTRFPPLYCILIFPVLWYSGFPLVKADCSLLGVNCVWVCRLFLSLCCRKGRNIDQLYYSTVTGMFSCR